MILQLEVYFRDRNWGSNASIVTVIFEVYRQMVWFYNSKCILETEIEYQMPVL